jgi:hypothetical protein
MDPHRNKSNYKPVMHPYDTGDDSTECYPTPTPDDGYRWIGKATPGTATSAPGWQIKRILYVAGEAAQVHFAVNPATGKATNLKIFVWDDFTTYAYST